MPENTTIKGVDCSKYQGVITEQIAKTMRERGIQFAWVRSSAGGDYQDGQFLNTIVQFRKVGIKFGAYHFVDSDDKKLQLAQFTKVLNLGLGVVENYDLPPCIDVEAFSSINGVNYAQRMLKYEKLPMRLAASTKSAIFGYSYPNIATVDYLLGGLKTWLKDHPIPQVFEGIAMDVPGIYTNIASGNTVFGSNTAYNKYPLWEAHWRVKEPIPPAAWKGQKLMAWQTDVIDAAPLGFSAGTKIDADQWMDKYPFPGTVTPPPPPTNEKVGTVTIELKQDTPAGIYVVEFTTEDKQ